jgi:hypothetical protein
MESIGKLLMILGLVLVGVGLLLMFGSKLPWLGKLPGDIIVERKNFTFYFPITTSILISLILSLLLWLWGRK